MLLFRLTRRKYAGTNPFDGEGSFRFGGRWSSADTRLCYTATHRSLAILEYRVNLDPSALPPDLVMATLEIPDSTIIAACPPLPEDWRDYPAPASLRAIGDHFIKAGASAFMRVPSVVVPEEDNILFSPLHADAAKSRRYDELVSFRYDRRLL